MADEMPADAWLGSMQHHEGLPLALRVRPGADSPKHRSQWPRLAAITHVLAKVQGDGLPEADYNETLYDLDSAIVGGLDADSAGLTVIVETFAGKRIYYAYVADSEHPRKVLVELRATFPDQELKLGGGSDPEWGMWADYLARFKWQVP